MHIYVFCHIPHEAKRVLLYRRTIHHNIGSSRRLLKTTLGIITAKPDTDLGTLLIYVPHQSHLLRLLVDVVLTYADYC
jgi:hypothetical protein